ncbi:MAG: FadR family transcriptional regulator [Rhodobacteraceae bacterium]|nr:FadR family transcriptional regulator [Paracoccaceae bacterium]
MAQDALDALMRRTEGEESLRREIESRLNGGEWPAQTRLPTERALAEAFGIGRARVRRILEDFERAGRIVRNVGRGTFVAEASPVPPAEGSPAALAADMEEVSPEDLMEARLLIEPQLVGLAVRRASPSEIMQLRDLVAQGERAGSMAEFERIDHDFHDMLAGFARNAFLAGMLRSIQSLRRAPAWGGLRRRGLTEDRRRRYQVQHAALVEAIEARDHEGACDLMRRHLEEVRGNLWL